MALQACARTITKTTTGPLSSIPTARILKPSVIQPSKSAQVFAPRGRDEGPKNRRPEHRERDLRSRISTVSGGSSASAHCSRCPSEIKRRERATRPIQRRLEAFFTAFLAGAFFTAFFFAAALAIGFPSLKSSESFRTRQLCTYFYSGVDMQNDFGPPIFA